MGINYEDVSKYVEEQFEGKCRVLSAKIESTFNDLGFEVRVWNVKTDIEGSWWVVEGNGIPMNLYPQEAYYFSTDEVYSFHIGLMERMLNKSYEYKSKDFVRAMTLNNELAPNLFRKLKNIATLINSAKEVEDFQSIGVQCREVLIELANNIYIAEMAGEEEQPQKSNFKKKAELFVNFYLSGSENSDYRSYIKKITETVWDYTNKITHSQNATIYEVSSCVSLTVSLICTYENIRQKVFAPLDQYICKYCKSKKLNIIDDESNEEGIVTKLYLKCEECNKTTEVIFEKVNDNDPKYIKGIIK